MFIEETKQESICRTVKTVMIDFSHMDLHSCCRFLGLKGIAVVTCRSLEALVSNLGDFVKMERPILMKNMEDNASCIYDTWVKLSSLSHSLVVHKVHALFTFRLIPSGNMLLLVVLQRFLRQMLFLIFYSANFLLTTRKYCVH